MEFYTGPQASVHDRGASAAAGTPRLASKLTSSSRNARTSSRSELSASVSSRRRNLHYRTAAVNLLLLTRPAIVATATPASAGGTRTPNKIRRKSLQQRQISQNWESSSEHQQQLHQLLRQNQTPSSSPPPPLPQPLPELQQQQKQQHWDQQRRPRPHVHSHSLPLLTKPPPPPSPSSLVHLRKAPTSTSPKTAPGITTGPSKLANIACILPCDTSAAVRPVVIQQYQQYQPTYPAFSSAYIPNPSFLPSASKPTTASTRVTPAGGRTAGAADLNTVSNDTALPPPCPSKHTPTKLTKPDPRMVANAGRQGNLNKHNKQPPARPPKAVVDSSNLVLTPARTVTSPGQAVSSRPSLLPRSSSFNTAPTLSSLQKQQHLQPLEDSQSYNPVMVPEPRTPNPSNSSQQPLHLTLQAQVLCRFSVPFARTESFVSSKSAATILSNRTTQLSDPPPASTEGLSSRPFIVRNGRTFLNDQTLPYPLPVDLAELHRQSLRTLLLFQLFGGPICSPSFQSKPPSRVLEVGCGTGFWSMMCHRYFAQHGHHNISFTGVDIAPLATSPGFSGTDSRPDCDMKWRFVQHDLRRTPWPFKDAEFDLIMVKDISMAATTSFQQLQMEEVIRTLRPGGTVELWDSDHTIRMLRPHNPVPQGNGEDEEFDHAESLGAYVMTANTPLSAPLNNYLVEYNGWLSKAFDARSLSVVPCTILGPMLLQESEVLSEVRSRRLAVPLCEMRWEREGVGGTVTKGGKTYIESKGKSRGVQRRGPLSAGQSALRRTALLTVVQMIQSLEPVLREVNGKRQDEWDGWAGKMMGDLMGGGTAWGECLEVGAWWAKKRM